MGLLDKLGDFFLPAVSGIQNGLNMVFQEKQNKRSQDFSREMYNTQRQHSLMDWQMQNAYNSPQQQMERLKAAGLNPHLVYGNGATATSESQPRSSQASPAQFNAPRVDFTSGVMGYADMAVKQAQTDNIKAMTKLAEIDQGKRLVEIANTIAGTRKTDQDRLSSELSYKRDTELYDTIIAQAKQTLGKTTAETGNIQAQTKSTLDENSRRQALQQPTLQKVAAEIANIKSQTARTDQERENLRATIHNIRQQYDLNEFEIELNKRGFTKSDPVYLRLAEKLAEGGINNFKKMWSNPQKTIIQRMNDIFEWLGEKPQD